MIQTVLGMVSEDKIKKTLAHEHIVFGKAGFYKDIDNCYNREIAYKNSIERINMIKKCDVNLLVDTTPIEWGRDVELMKKLSEDTDVNIVCATGFFKDEEDMLAILKSLSYFDSVEEFCKSVFEKEIIQGIGNTGVKAGIIKVASSLGQIKPLEREIFKAAICVAKQYDIAITTHCDRGTMATEQVKLFEKEGADANNIIIGHMTSNTDLQEIMDIADKGYNVCFDQFGILSIPGIPTDEEKMTNLLELLKNGYGEKIVLSHDCIFDRMGYVSKSKPRYPDMIFNRVVPFLKENGISDEIINKITRDNLLKILERRHN